MLAQCAPQDHGRAPPLAFAEPGFPVVGSHRSWYGSGVTASSSGIGGRLRAQPPCEPTGAPPAGTAASRGPRRSSYVAGGAACLPCGRLPIADDDIAGDLPEFPTLRQPLRESAVTNAADRPIAYTAKEKQAGVHLGASNKKKRSAAHAFERLALKRNDYQQFQDKLLVYAAPGQAVLSCATGSCGYQCRQKNGPLGCVGLFGVSPQTAMRHLFEYVRVPHVGDTATTQKRVRAFVDKSTGVKSMADRKKRGPQKAMHDRLLQRLHASVYYDPTATNPTTGKPGYYLYDYKLPSASGVMVAVCPHFFRAVMGYSRNDAQWLNCLEEARKAAMAVTDQVSRDLEATAEKAYPEEPNTSRKGRITLAWLATFIKLYTVAMPMKKELRMDFANKKQLYQFLKNQYCFARGLTTQVVDEQFFVGFDAFRKYLKKKDDIGVLRDAIAEKVRALVGESGEQWRLVFHDPSKKRDFKICSACAKIAETRTGAVAAANKTLFNQQLVYMDVHTRVVAARRNQFMANQRMAENEVTDMDRLMIDD